MAICLTGARFTMKADVLRWEGITTGDADDTTEGAWDTYQDPITGEIMNTWVPGTAGTTDSPPEDIRTINCLARGIVDGGIRVAGTTERFGDTYENIDYVKLWTPPKTKLSKRDRITNIRNKKNGQVLWLDEEGLDPAKPTVFNVQSVTPLFDAFNAHVENYILLERA